MVDDWMALKVVIVGSKITAVITIGIVVTVSKPTDVLELQETGKRSIGIRQSLFNVSAARCI